MSIKLQVGTETYDYPETGDSNYGEEATAWAEAITEALKSVFGPADIPTTETTLTGIDNGNGTVTGNITGLVFDTSFVQEIEIKGIIKREYNTLATKVENFNITGSYNGSVFNIAPVYVGDDTEVIIEVTGGQFTFTSNKNADDALNGLTIKFKATAIVDESLL